MVGVVVEQRRVPVYVRMRLDHDSGVLVSVVLVMNVRVLVLF